MNTHADKTQENKTQSIANDVARKQRDSGAAFQFVDNRPEAIIQRQVQEMADHYTLQHQHPIQKKEDKTEQRRTIRRGPFVDKRPEAMVQPEVQEMADNNTNSFQPTIRKKANKTGLFYNLKYGGENLSGFSMDDVKVHYNSPKPAQIKAHAYAHGTNIHVATRQEKHLPHEAWHVVKQKEGRVKATKSMAGVQINDDKGLEKKADIKGVKDLQMKATFNSITEKGVSRENLLPNAVTRKQGDEEDIGTSKKEKKEVFSGKHKEEKVWKTLQRKEKILPNSQFRWAKVNSTPIQGQWISKYKRPKFWLLEWKQTLEDDCNRADGWYTSSDFKHYEKVHLEDTEIDVIRAERKTVLVRPWIVTMRYPGGEETSADADQLGLDQVFTTIKEIWKQAEIDIKMDAPLKRTIEMSKELNAYENGNDIVNELNAALRGQVNPEIQKDFEAAREGIQAVFVPSYDRWGFTYHKGDIFDGPVTFITTLTAGVGDAPATRSDQTPKKYINLAISLDAAHEIGHAFGLEHVEKQSEVQLLMHSVLYNSFLNAAKKPNQTDAKQMAVKIFNQYTNPIIFKRTKEDVQYWSVMHGAKFTKEQVKTVWDKITDHSVWE